VAAIRAEGYEMLRVPSLPMLDLTDISNALGSASTDTYIVPPDSAAAEKTIGRLQLRTKTGVSVISIIHDGNAEINPGPDTVINPGDVLVLLGTPEKIDRAIELCLGGSASTSDQKSSS
jgi:K+/H+ antiporter YhaU regulatory subunit KhtT